MWDAEEAVYRSLEELPDDPLAMPPPYWLKSEGYQVLANTLDEIGDVLEDIPELFEKAVELDYFSDVPYWERGLSDDDAEDVRAVYWEFEEA